MAVTLRSDLLRFSGAPVTIDDDRVAELDDASHLLDDPDALLERWTGEPPAMYASRSGVMRGFCGTCGSPMFYRNDARV